MENSEDKHGTGSRGVPQGGFGWWGKLAVVMAPIALTFISLGEATDAGFLLRDMYDEMYSVLSKQPEYDVIEGLHVGNTEEYVIELAGMPEVSRHLSDGTTAKYIMRGDYLLTLLFDEGRLTAYTVTVLNDEFTPDCDVFMDEKLKLGSFTYADIPIDVTTHEVDVSSHSQYYVESYDAGRAGHFLQAYLGSINFGVGEMPDDVTSLYNVSLGAPASMIENAKAELRRTGRPNFYGRGELQLAQIIESLLTRSEFAAYFSK